MGKGVFRSHNKVGETLSFQIMADSAISFTPKVGKSIGRVSWDVGLGKGYITGNALVYSYPLSASGTQKTVTVRTNLLSTLNSIYFEELNILGHLDLSGLSNLFSDPTYADVNLSDNGGLTGVTHTYTPYVNKTYVIGSSNLMGTLDLRPLGEMGGEVIVNNNPNLTRILFSGGTGGFDKLYIHNNDLVDCDLSGFQNFTQAFSIRDNSNLTGMTFNTGTSITTTSGFYAAELSSYVGTLDLTGLKLYSRFSITGTPCVKILHGFYNGSWIYYDAYRCNLTGNHDLTMFPTLGGVISLGKNASLTGVTHTGSTALTTDYGIHQCNLIGNLDVSMLKLSGIFDCSVNPNLTSITHGNTSSVFSEYDAHSCNLGPTLVVSGLTGLGGQFDIHDNPNLSSVHLPYSTETFSEFDMYGCNFSGSSINFMPLSGITTEPSGAHINVQNNNFTAAAVNQQLRNFGQTIQYNTAGWSGVTLNISGTNSAPDSTSGGVNGISALSFLTGSPNNWIVTTS